MELSTVLSGPDSVSKKLVRALESAGFTVEHPCTDHRLPVEDLKIGFVRCHRIRTDPAVPVVLPDSEVDAVDLNDAIEIASTVNWSLRKHSHRSTPVESDEDHLRRIVREELARNS